MEILKNRRSRFMSEDMLESDIVLDPNLTYSKTEPHLNDHKKFKKSAVIMINQHQPMDKLKRVYIGKDKDKAKKISKRIDIDSDKRILLRLPKNGVFLISRPDHEIILSKDMLRYKKKVN